MYCSYLKYVNDFLLNTWKKTTVKTWWVGTTWSVAVGYLNSFWFLTIWELQGRLNTWTS